MGAVPQMGKQERENYMKNCYPIQSCNHFMHRAFLLLTSLFLFLFVFTCGTQAYELNGTATGNILNNGYAAETDGFSVYADIENGYALTIEKENETIVADPDNAQYINICGEKVYYTSVDGEARETTLRCYDVSSDHMEVLYAVPLEQGMKNLMVVDGKALLITNGDVISIDLSSGEKTTVLCSDIFDFVPVSGGFVYTVNGKSDLYFFAEGQNVVTLASDVLSFDCVDDAVYYSNGVDGIYRVALDGSDRTRVAEGGTDLVYTDDLYWTVDNAVFSLNGGKESVVENAESAVITVLGSDVAVEENEMVSMDDVATLASDDEGISLSSVTLSALPDGDYKLWKQGSGSPWANYTLGNSTIGSIGCMAVAVSILLVGSGAEKDRYLVYQSGALPSIDDKRGFNPAVFVKEMSANGGFDKGGAMYWSRIHMIYSDFGTSPYDTGKGTSSNFYNMKQVGSVSQSSSIKNHLAAGKYIIICVDNHRTGNTHWLAVDYATDDGIFVCDPGYRTDSTPFNVYDVYSKVTRAIIFNYKGTRWDGSGEPVDPGDIPELEWENPFTDVKESHWFYDNVAEVNQAGWMVGRSKTQFAPYASMTRKEYVCLVGRLSGLTDSQFASYGQINFADVKYNSSNKWYTKYLAWALKNEVMVGEEKNGKLYFNPDDNITREQICAVLVRLSGKVSADISPIERPITFADAKKISPWAKDSVNTAQRAGLIYGSLDYGKYYMNPQDNATRAEVAAIFLRFTRRMPIS